MIGYIGVNYPLRNDWAEFTLGLESIIVFISIQWFLSFLGKFLLYRKKMNKNTHKRNLAWAFIFLSLGITFFIYIMADYIVSPERREYLNLWGYFSLSLGGFIFLIISERIKKEGKYPFSLIALILLIIIIIGITINFTDLILIVGIFGTALTSLYLLQYRRLLINTTNNSPKIRRKIDFLLLGFILIGLGFGFFTDESQKTLGFSSRIIADILIITGMLLGVKNLQEVPDYTELDWLKKLKSLLIIDKTGICIFSRAFKANIAENSSQAVISGGLKSVEAILKEATKGKQLKKVKMGNNIFLFKEKKNLTFVLIADESMEALRIRLEQFAQKFMKLFHNYLNDWDGHLDVFYPADEIIEEIFKPL